MWLVNWINEGYYYELKEFETKQQALDFIEKAGKQNVCALYEVKSVVYYED